jgi:hypothetical protein
VLEIFTELIDEFSGAALDDLGGDPGGRRPSSEELFTASLTTAFEARFGDDSPVVGYLRRLLVDGGPAAETLFDALYGAVSRMCDELTARGILRPTDDPAVRAAFLLVNDLALMLLRDQLTHALGVDPLGRSGMQRWAAGLISAYRDGVFATPAAQNNRERHRKKVDDDRTGD